MPGPGKEARSGHAWPQPIPPLSALQFVAVMLHSVKTSQPSGQYKAMTTRPTSKHRLTGVPVPGTPEGLLGIGVVGTACENVREGTTWHKQPAEHCAFTRGHRDGWARIPPRRILAASGTRCKDVGALLKEAWYNPCSRQLCRLHGPVTEWGGVDLLNHSEQRYSVIENKR
jgi:hypothetical protein